jgi:hypothetical protein
MDCLVTPNTLFRWYQKLIAQNTVVLIIEAPDICSRVRTLPQPFPPQWNTLPFCNLKVPQNAKTAYVKVHNNNLPFVGSSSYILRVMYDGD